MDDDTAPSLKCLFSSSNWAIRLSSPAGITEELAAFQENRMKLNNVIIIILRVDQGAGESTRFKEGEGPVYSVAHDTYLPVVLSKTTDI